MLLLYVCRDEDGPDAYLLCFAGGEVAGYMYNGVCLFGYFGYSCLLCPTCTPPADSSHSGTEDLLSGTVSRPNGTTTSMYP